MNKKKYLIINFGYPRALSTYFQKNVFSINNQINYFGKPYRNRKIEEIIYSVMFLSEENFSNIKSNFISQLKNLFKNNNENILISEEIFSCLFIFTLNNFKNKKINFKFEKFDNNKEKINLKIILIRIRTLFIESNIFDDLKIIFFLRNQNEILNSFFYKHYNFFKINKIYSFSSLINDENNNQIKKIFIDNFNYYKTINSVSNNIDINNIGIFLIEKFRNNPNLFFNDLNKFLETNITFNKSLNNIRVNKLESNFFSTLEDKFKNFLLSGDFSINNIFRKFKFLFLTFYKMTFNRKHMPVKNEISETINIIKLFYNDSNKKIMSEYFKNSEDQKYFEKYYFDL